jgi:hypothetical protein
MRSVIPAAVAAALLLAPVGAAFAEDEDGLSEDLETYEKQAREGLATLMMALESFIESIPQYEMPEVLENGDIIIRRANPDEPRSSDEEPGTDPKDI